MIVVVDLVILGTYICVMFPLNNAYGSDVTFLKFNTSLCIALTGIPDMPIVSMFSSFIVRSVIAVLINAELRIVLTVFGITADVSLLVFLNSSYGISVILPKFTTLVIAESWNADGPIEDRFGKFTSNDAELFLNTAYSIDVTVSGRITD